MSKPQVVTDRDFAEKVLQAKGPVLVDFWADWCGPCKMIAPVVDELSDEYEGKVSFAKVDVDANPTTAARLGIHSIPTLLIFKDGKVADHVVGVAPKAALKKKIERVLAVAV